MKQGGGMGQGCVSCDVGGSEGWQDRAVGDGQGVGQCGRSVR